MPEQRVPRVLKADDTFMLPAIDDLLLETDRRVDLPHVHHLYTWFLCNCGIIDNAVILREKVRRKCGIKFIHSTRRFRENRTCKLGECSQMANG